MMDRNADLVYLLHSNNLITRPLGVNIHKKVKGERSIRLYVLLVALWLDTAYTIALAFIPTSEEALLLELGDYAFHLVHVKRYFMVGVMIFYRLSSSSMVSCFAWDSFDWCREANRIFLSRRTPKLMNRLIRIRNRCRVIAVAASSYLSTLVMLALLMCTIIYRERNSRYFLAPAYTYICYYSIMYTSLHVQFMMELYFLCKICQELFIDINQQLKQDLIHSKAYHRFLPAYRHFSSICLFTQRVNSYIVRIYITFFVCNLTVVVLLFYSALYANFNLISKSIYITFLVVELVFIVFFSQVIGTIDTRAKECASAMYYEFSLQRSGRRQVKHFSSQLMRYFQTVFGSTISMVILDSSINSNTSITILTIVLTVMAFLISNFRND